MGEAMADQIQTKNPQPHRNNAGVVVPPPLIFATTLAAGILLDRFVTFWSIPLGDLLPYALALPLAGIGVALAVLALGLFRKANTRPEPWRPSSALVSDGIYRFTRNPMYLGMAFAYVAIALAFGSMSALALLAPLLLVIRYGVIGREERYLTAEFGEDYRRYQAKVRRWL